MTGFACSAVVFGIASAFAVRGWRRRHDSPLFVLRLLPPALLFVALGALLAAVGIITGFQHIAETGGGGIAAAGAMANDALRSLQLGVLGGVLGLSVAAALQAFATGLVDPPDAEAAAPDRAETAVLVAGAVIAVPTAYLVSSLWRLITQFMAAAVELTAPGATSESLSATPNDVAQGLANHLLQTLGLGGAIALSLLLLTPGTLLLARSRRRAGAMTVATWCLVGLLLTTGLVAAYALERDIRRIDVIVKNAGPEA